MLGVIQKITPLLFNDEAKENPGFLSDFSLNKSTAAQRPEHIISFLTLSVSICVHLRLIKSFSLTYFRITPSPPYFAECSPKTSALKR